MNIKTLKAVHLRIRNSRPYALTLRIEPWAEELPMPAGSLYEIVAQGPDDDCIEVSSNNEAFTVYGWSGSIISVFQDQALLLECRIPVPPVP
jgi:hypothetical protein